MNQSASVLEPLEPSGRLECLRVETTSSCKLNWSTEGSAKNGEKMSGKESKREEDDRQVEEGSGRLSGSWCKDGDGCRIEVGRLRDWVEMKAAVKGTEGEMKMD